MTNQCNQLKDGRSSNGGKRKNAGRKGAASEEERLKVIENALGDKGLDVIWAKITELAKTGSKDHINFLFNYYYGRPKEHVDITSNGDSIPVAMWVKSDKDDSD